MPATRSTAGGLHRYVEAPLTFQDRMRAHRGGTLNALTAVLMAICFEVYRYPYALVLTK
jgi:hypothetical protein